VEVVRIFKDRPCMTMQSHPLQVTQVKTERPETGPLWNLTPTVTRNRCC
jgi:hypothetical protein